MITTQKGSIEIIEHKDELLRQIRDLMPYGAAKLGTPQNEIKYGLVMQCGEQEVFCIKMQPIELERNYAEQMFQIQHFMIVEAYCKFILHGYSGMYLACPYLRQRNNQLWEAGIANFIFPSKKGKETEIVKVSTAFDNQFGSGATTMFADFVADLRASFQQAKITFPSYFGTDVRSRSHLQSIAMNFMVLDSKIICVREKLREEEPAWSILVSNGISEICHLPSIPLAIKEQDLIHTKG
jgi:hypothetical protein